MATTNRVYYWKDGERLFVDINGATIEAKALTFDEQVVTLRFRGRITQIKTDDPPNTSPMTARARSTMERDPLLDASH